MIPSELHRFYERRLPRYTSYPTAPHFTAKIGPAAYREWLQCLPPEAPVSLYLHIPFCRTMCWYCGCHTTVAKNDGLIRHYARLLERELALLAAAIPHRPSISHIHLGGGTPNLLPNEDLVRLHRAIGSSFDILPGAEVAIECDPRSLDRDKIAALAAAGVTRVSLGVQDLDSSVQEAINRIQPLAVTQAAAEGLRAAGIGKINIDLMYGLPLQTLEGLGRTLQSVLALAPDRISLFGYAHVPWMKPHQKLIRNEDLPGLDERAAQYDLATEILAEASYAMIGLDHFARPEDELSQVQARGQMHRNFQGYTTDSAPNLLGVGASSIGFLSQGYVQNAASVADWRDAVESGEFATCRGIEISADDRLRRDIIMRLMCDLSLDLAEIANHHKVHPQMFGSELTEIDRLATEGIAWREGWRLGVTNKARPLIRTLCAVFDRYFIEADQKHSRAI